MKTIHFAVLSRLLWSVHRISQHGWGYDWRKAGESNVSIVRLCYNIFFSKMHSVESHMNVYYGFEILIMLCLSHCCAICNTIDCPDNKVHGANMGPIWGRQDPGGPHVGPTNFTVWLIYHGPVSHIIVWITTEIRLLSISETYHYDLCHQGYQACPLFWLHNIFLSNRSTTYD